MQSPSNPNGLTSFYLQDRAAFLERKAYIYERDRDLFYQVRGTTETPFPEGEGKKLFVYIRPGSDAFKPLFRVLADLGHPTLWFAPGLEVSARGTAPAHIRFATRPISLTHVAREADLAIVHGGHGTAAGMYTPRVPMVFLPETVEHMLLGHRLGQTSRVAVTVHIDNTVPLHASIKQLRLTVEALAGPIHFIRPFSCHDIEKAPANLQRETFSLGEG